MTANLIDNLEFVLDALVFGRRADINTLIEARQRQKEGIATLRAKYESNPHFHDWMDKAYRLICRSIDSFNKENNTNISHKRAAAAPHWIWEDCYEEEYTPEMIAKCFADQFEYIEE